LDAVSGDIEIVVEDIDENLDLNTVSGDVTLKFANEPDCTLIFKTLSGGFDSDFSNKNDKDDDSLVGKNLNVKYGNGNVRIKVETVSGGLRVTE